MAEAPTKPRAGKAARRRRLTAARIPTVVVDDAHVTYRAYEDRRPSLRSVVTSRGKPRTYRQIEALRGISFTAYAGEVIGVVGRNGSGKSTLLQALAGLLPVTAGAIHARSQPVLLGVGAALQPSLSGRRNIELGCLALGLTREQVNTGFDDIVAFSGLGDFIDLPLRTYSSGMRARLHFAIASAINPDILLIDEALAVGDADFKRRSEQRIKELKANAGTVFLVSHRLQEIRGNCNRVIWIDEGRCVRDGRPRKVVNAYQDAVGEPGGGDARCRRRRRR
ncbi:MAG: ABC transporter ATP-binding protein, partial [Euzebyales bacterium]|nr:ABC transporter ATP-binding protein [Euzebyales bacterium]